jgi:hypothetical protein
VYVYSGMCVCLYIYIYNLYIKGNLSFHKHLILFLISTADIKFSWNKVITDVFLTDASVTFCCIVRQAE